MGYFSNLAIEIEEAHAQGATVEQIAQQFGLLKPEVEGLLLALAESDRDPPPGD